MPSSACQKCARSEEHTSELQSHSHLVCRLLLEKKNKDSEGGGGSSHVAGGQVGHIATAAVAWSVCCVERVLCASLALVVVSGHLFFFFNDGAPPEFYPFPLPDALPISSRRSSRPPSPGRRWSHRAPAC